MCPGSERSTERFEDRVTHHSFSFGQHYDPDNLAFGPMRAFDDHHLAWGAGFDDHAHSEIELVTWVAHGRLVHTDSTGAREVLPAGTVQVQSAGCGIRHSERADTSSEPTRFLQTWLVPDEAGVAPARFVAQGMSSTSLRPVAGEGAEVPIGTAGATLWSGRLGVGEHEVPVCASHHLFLVNGAAALTAPGLEPVALAAGDAVRTGAASEAGMTLVVTEPEGCEVLLWTFRTPSA